MRKVIISIFAALTLAATGVLADPPHNVTHYTSSNDGGLIQGSSVTAGSISGATTVGTGFAGTYGISIMSAGTTGKFKTGESLSLIQGTSWVAGHSESGTLVEGAGAAGSIAGGEADAGFGGAGYFAEGSHQHRCHHGCGPRINRETTQVGDAWAFGGASGSSWAASGSIGDGEGLSVQGFEAYGEAKAKSKITNDGGEYTAITNVKTASGALSYTIEEGKAIGQTHAVGWGFAGADVWRVHEDD